MAQSATQRTTGVTRFKGPTVITLRGAGSKGNDPLTKGDGLDVGLSVQIPTGQSANAFQIEKPDGTVIYSIDKNGNVARGIPSIGFAVQVAITSAQLLAMSAAPVSVLAAPGAGIAIIVDYIFFEMKRTATAYANGGTVQFQYHTATTVVHQGVIPAARLTTAAAANTVDGLWAASPTNSLVCAINDGIDITNNTAPFITGTGTAIVTIIGNYLTLG